MKKPQSPETIKQTEPEKKEIEEISLAKDQKKEKYFEIKIPRLQLKNFNVKTILVISLIICAFALGFLTSKVMYLQDTLDGKTANAVEQTPDTNAAPQALPGEPTPPPAKVEVSDGHLPPLGDPDAKVTLVEFSDFQCPFCDQFEKNTYPQIYDEYIKTNKIKFVFRHYPLTTIHPNAKKAAAASECANDQDKFWDYHKMLFERQSTWSDLPLDEATNSFTDFATELGLNTSDFTSCLDSEETAKKVTEDINDGDKAFVNGTPTFFINGQRLVGAQPFEQIKQLIDQELNK